MKWTKSELLNLQDKELFFEEEVQFEDQAFNKASSVHHVEDVFVSGVARFNEQGYFEVELDVEGVLVCFCSVTNELVEVPFETNSHEIFSFVDTEDIEIHVVKNEVVELAPIVFQLILLEVPLRVVKDGSIEYPQGDGWRIYSEKDFEESKKRQVDPRLAKLKDFKVEKK